jgi:scyllo-inositol 2-dehydrogenase (NADP+)
MTALLKVGLLGYGFSGATFHAPVIEYCGQAIVAAIATGKSELASAAYPRAMVVPNLDALLALDDIKCVVIATPNDTHYEFAKRALEAGKHVVVDKPVTLTAKEARTLANLALERGLVFAPFHNRRWDGDFLTVRDLLADRTLGRITHFESHFDRFRPDVQQRWREQESRGGGLLFDIGPHLIDQALALFGTPEAVTANLKTHRVGGAVDYVHLILSYKDLEVVLHASALAALPAPRFAVNGTRGSYVKCELDSQEDQLKTGLRPGDAGFGSGNPSGVLYALDGGNQLVRGSVATRDGDYGEFYRALAATILRGEQFPVSPQDAVDVMTIIELAERSERDGCRVRFERIC